MFTKRNTSFVVAAALILITFFAMFLRYEDFREWEKNKSLFQYENEYILGNLDGYINLIHANDIAEGSYDGVDEMRNFPNGVARPKVPPLLSVLAVIIHKVTGLSLPIVAIFIPIFLSSLIVPLIYLIARRFNFNRIVALLAALLSTISITDVMRTRIGYFDTDCLIVVFIFLNSYLILLFSKEPSRKRHRYLLFAFMNTFLFYIFWYNASSIVIISLLFPLFIALIFFYKAERKLYMYSFLALVSLLSLYLLSDEILKYWNLVLGESESVFKVNDKIGELINVDLNEYIKKTINNKFLILLSGLGIVYFIWKHKTEVLFFTIPILLGCALPFFAGSRFLIFSTPFIALGIASFVEFLTEFKIKNKVIIYSTCVGIATLGIYSNYNEITEKIQKQWKKIHY